ncbi:23S rRNA pseudouridine1911/1915/1917 synthase [Desulfonatronum thiosulfatophilum]|uniref:23S rRNA pseudouridine1911/1915/1917 synthase n=2 Tax=Desulfonatronum thiosulfatophilum TaxID=617002 RepID=A0A1G6BJ77_9BACT|nr:23S rRNA pseudouridine1911/1915/1917 synthase [Desulfonatronum thiosulfatophilum]
MRGGGEWTVPHDCQGLRLDQALMRCTSGLGRRGARRVFEQCLVLVEGRRRVAGFRVQAGQRISLRPLESGRGDVESRNPDDHLPVVLAARDESFAALVKPSGMHSEVVAGSTGPSIEAVLPELFPGIPAILLNRLDQSVSGLLLVALGDPAAQKYAAWQEQGLVRKQYLAAVRGNLSEEMLIQTTLDTAKRRRVRPIPGIEPDPLRWTRALPLSSSDERDESLVLVEILKGRRHQIRAHLAWAGHPVVLDPLYGPGPDLGWIYLHHCRIDLPDFSASVLPCWKEWQVNPLWKHSLPEDQSG